MAFQAHVTYFLPSDTKENNLNGILTLFSSTLTVVQMTCLVYSDNFGWRTDWKSSRYSLIILPSTWSGSLNLRTGSTDSLKRWRMNLSWTDIATSLINWLDFFHKSIVWLGHHMDHIYGTLWSLFVLFISFYILQVDSLTHCHYPDWAIWQNFHHVV